MWARSVSSSTSPPTICIAEFPPSYCWRSMRSKSSASTRRICKGRPSTRRTSDTLDGCAPARYTASATPSTMRCTSTPCLLQKANDNGCVVRTTGAGTEADSRCALITTSVSRTISTAAAAARRLLRLRRLLLLLRGCGCGGGLSRSGAVSAGLVGSVPGSGALAPAVGSAYLDSSSIGGNSGWRSPGSRVTLPLRRFSCWLRITLYFAFVSIAAWTPSRMIVGRMNSIRLRFSLLPVRVLNSSPMIGIEPRIGTRFSLSRAVSVIRPPSTITPPSSTSTVVVTVRLLVIRSTAPCVPGGDTLSASCSILRINRVAFVDLRRDLEDRRRPLRAGSFGTGSRSGSARVRQPVWLTDRSGTALPVRL